MGPDSITLIVLLLAAVLALFWVSWRYAHLFVRGTAALLIIALSGVTGMAIVNDFYGYYRSWGQLTSDLSGSYSAFANTTAVRTDTSASGLVRPVTITGKASGITRSGLVYLPPQYFDHRYAHTAFPVVELLHGSPGTPSQWLGELGLARVMNDLLTRHEIGPEILVMPSMNAGNDFQDGVNGPGGQDDTYLTQDVRSFVLAHYRASTDPAQWGIAGYSSGGYAAANLALRHRAMFGAAGVMDGYFRPQDGPAQQALGGSSAAQAQNNPLRMAATLPAGTAPLPAFWLSAGTGDAADYAGAQAFVHALSGVEQVTLAKEIGAGHNFYDWSAALPSMLAWTWTQLAPPDLKVQFPVAGAVRGASLVAPPIPAVAAAKLKLLAEQAELRRLGVLLHAQHRGTSAVRSAEHSAGQGVVASPKLGLAHRAS